MKLARSIQKMWKTRDELSPRNFRAEILPVFLALPLAVIIGDLRFLDQELMVLGVDSNNLILVAYGLGFLAILALKERHMALLLRMSALAQAVLLCAQLLMGPGIPRLIVYLLFHAANGACTACGYYLFAFFLNNVERLFTVVVVQLYYAFIYVFWNIEPVADFFKTYGSAAVMLALVSVSLIEYPSRREQIPEKVPDSRESGVYTIIFLNMVYYVIMLMTMYIEYQETTVSDALYGAGGFACVAIVFIVMLVCNYSALHLWSLCLVCSVLGIGALYYTSVFTINAGSFFYGVGEGLGFMIIFYMQGGAIKRSGSFRLLRMWCLFTSANFVVISGIFYVLYEKLDAPNIHLAFPTVLLLALVCFLLSPILQKKLFRTDWTDGYHMADMPLYAQALEQVEQIDNENSLGLTPREMEIFTLLLTESSPRQIAVILRVSYSTVNFHSKNLYRKLGIQSRTELFALYGSRQGTLV